MRTYKPLSTISYNTQSNLRIYLEALIEKGSISFYAFLKHYGEGGKKDHFHVYIEPQEEIDTNAQWFREWFIEKSDDPPCKPLNVEPWRKSKFDDWVLYSQHDSAYLAQKGLKKEYTDYGLNCFISSDDSEFKARESLINRQSFLPPVTRMLNCVQEGLNVIEAMQALRIPYGAMGSFIKAYDICKQVFAQNEIAGYDKTTGELDPNFDPEPITRGSHINYLRKDI